jgi:hypothetical protein
MSAIQLARLKKQASQLADMVDKPEDFVHSLHKLLDFYADRTHRPGQAGEPPPLLSQYRVPIPVLRQIESEVISRLDKQTQENLNLLDRIWEEPNFEFRLLAATLLGRISPSPPEAVTERIHAWASSTAEQRLLSVLLVQGLERTRREALNEFLQQVENWLAGPTMLSQKIGLRAILPLITEGEFENIPVIFRLITPFTRALPAPLRSDLLDVMSALALRSPKETAYFLRQNLELPASTDTAWIIRQCLRQFPNETRESLHAALRETNKIL